MSNYTKATNFATKDALTSGNPLKTLSGTELDDEFNAIQTASATKANIASAQLTGIPVAPTAAADTNTTQLATTAFVTTEANLKADLAGAAFTGAITTTSTIDGRDVAADGVTADAALPKAGGTMTGNITGLTALDVTGTVTADGLVVDGTAAVNGSNDSATNYLNGDATLLVSNTAGTNTTNLKLENDAAIAYGGGANTLVITDRQNERLRIDSSGNVGIGTVSPSRNLSVEGSSGTRTISSATVDMNTRLRPNSQGGIEIGSTTSNVYLHNLTDGGATIFSTRSSSVDYERMRIDSAGYVGIGGSTITDVNLLNLQGAGASKNIGMVLNDTTTGRIFNISNGGNALKFFDYTASAERMRIDSSGNVGIGVVPESWRANDYVGLRVGTGAAVYGRGSTDEDKAGLASNAYYDNTNDRWQYIATKAATNYYQVSGQHIFYVAPSGSADGAITFSAAVTIDNSGNLLVGTTTLAAIDNTPTANGVALRDEGTIMSSVTSGGNAVEFRTVSNGVAGTINCSGTSTSYNTSSDYRLKEADVPMTGATERVKALRPINFAWKADGKRVDGFYAHELAEVVPEAATGTKDAMRDEEYEVTPAVLDAEGTEVTEAVMGTRSVPDYQGIDQSKLVPLLTATIQELIARIETLEAGV